MNVELTVRHYEASERVKTYAVEEVEKFIKLHERIVNCKILLERTKEGDMAEINLHIAGKLLIATETSDDMLKSIDQAVQKMERQLKKFKAKRYTNARSANSRQDIQG